MTDYKYLIIVCLTSEVYLSPQQPAFILEEKAPDKSTKGDGDGREAVSLSHGPASLSLTHTDSPGPWQSESLMVESWSTMGDMDPEDTKSLDSSDGAALTGEENHSSNSDMVHLEREEAEMFEEADKEEEKEEEDEELQTSMLSVLGGERELVEEVQDLCAPETEEPQVSAEEPHLERRPAEFMQVVPPMALPPLPIVKLDPPSTTSTPVQSTATTEAEEHYSTQGLHPPSILVPLSAEAPMENIKEQKFSQIPLSDVEEHLVEASEAAPEKATALSKTAQPLSSTELLCGGAALVAIVGVVAYGAVAYCRK